MINLTTIGGQPVTMSSREITELTGKQHKHVIRDIREMLDALEKDGPVLGHVREDKDSRGYTENFHLDRELTETLVTGYSIPLRHKVIRRLHELEEQVAQPAIPQTLPEALRLAADLAEECQQLAAERDHAVKTKAQIGSRREAQAMAKASSAVRQVQRLNDELGHGTRFATVTAVEIAAGEKFPSMLTSPCASGARPMAFSLRTFLTGVMGRSRHGRQLHGWPFMALI
ncbi:Rha family transcriptional regulator [Pseudomonas aeruginosa]